MVTTWPKLSVFETWVVGNGEAIDFREDKWLDSKTRLRDFALNIPVCLLHVKVRDLLTKNGCWNVDILLDVLPNTIINRIHALMPPANREGDDRHVWPS